MYYLVYRVILIVLCQWHLCFPQYCSFFPRHIPFRRALFVSRFATSNLHHRWRQFVMATYTGFSWNVVRNLVYRLVIFSQFQGSVSKALSCTVCCKVALWVVSTSARRSHCGRATEYFLRWRTSFFIVTLFIQIQRKSATANSLRIRHGRIVQVLCGCARDYKWTLKFSAQKKSQPVNKCSKVVNCNLTTDRPSNLNNRQHPTKALTQTLISGSSHPESTSRHQFRTKSCVACNASLWHLWHVLLHSAPLFEVNVHCPVLARKLTLEDKSSVMPSEWVIDPD